MNLSTGTKVLGTIVPIPYDADGFLRTMTARRSPLNPIGPLQALAPMGDIVRDYDRRHLAIYVALLDAEDAHQNWKDVAGAIMQIDVSAAGAEACWRSHLERARWIVGEGLETAIQAFGEPLTQKG